MDTTRLTLQQCADLAGTRVTPYPEQVIVAPPHVCQGCGKALNGTRSRNTHALRVYCDRSCQRRARSQFNRQVVDDRSLLLTEYYWSEW